VIDQVTAVADDPTDWNEISRPTGSLTDIGADASQHASSHPAVVAIARVAVATGTTTTVTASSSSRSDPTTTRPRATRSTMAAGGFQNAPGQLVAGPLVLTAARRNRVVPTAAKFAWSPPAFSNDES
jgi:hypothetical protein